MSIRSILKNTWIRTLYYRLEHKVPDRIFIEHHYKKVLGVKPNLDNPKTFNEKMNWLKLHNRDPKLSVYCDKWAVREYVTEKIGADHLIPVYGVYDSADDIDWDKLPNSFVIKPSHDSGSVIVCKDKPTIDVQAVKRAMNGHLRSNYYYVGREWPYKNVKPRIIIEKMLADKIVDYKFYVFNGVPKYLYLGQGLVSDHSLRIAFYDMNWVKAPFGRSDYMLLEGDAEKPACFDEMKEIARKLAGDLPFARVDLYCVDGKIYFSEITLTPGSGFTPYQPPQFDRILGDMVDLSKFNAR